MIQREILIGVSGGIAAYKAADLVSKLVQSGHSVSVAMSRAAAQFVGAPTFAALSGHAVTTDLFDPTYPLGAHIELARRADLFCVAPATANFLARAANGFGDDLLSALYLSFEGGVIMAPAMNQEMWAKPSVQRNVQRLKEDGVTFVGPDEGWLSCRDKGMGRMSDVADILHAIDSV